MIHVLTLRIEVRSDGTDDAKAAREAAFQTLELLVDRMRERPGRPWDGPATCRELGTRFTLTTSTDESIQ